MHRSESVVGTFVGTKGRSHCGSADEVVLQSPTRVAPGVSPQLGSNQASYAVVVNSVARRARCKPVDTRCGECCCRTTAYLYARHANGRRVSTVECVTRRSGFRILPGASSRWRTTLERVTSAQSRRRGVVNVDIRANWSITMSCAGSIAIKKQKIVVMQSTVSIHRGFGRLP